VSVRFRDRADAGRLLAAAVADRAPGPDPVVLGLPRGGVPVAASVAAALHAPLDVFVVRKLGVPQHRELAMGAVASGGVRVVNDDVVRRLGIPAGEIERVAGEEQVELVRRERAYRGERGPLALGGRAAVLVDDGVATGASLRAAVQAVRALGPAQVVVAVPVGAPDAVARLTHAADDVVCLHAPASFGAVGAFYADFRQTTDDEVRAALATAG
jgi:predicted phosphoribosyltransferase